MRNHALVWLERTKGVSLSIQRAQAQMAAPYTPGVARRQARRTAAGAAQWAPVLSQPERPPPTTAVVALRLLRRDSPYGYYGGPGAWSQDYAARNGIICQPGTMVRLDDGLMHRCQ
jgi:hypothetical protein